MRSLRCELPGWPSAFSSSIKNDEPCGRVDVRDGAEPLVQSRIDAIGASTTWQLGEKTGASILGEVWEQIKSDELFHLEERWLWVQAHLEGEVITVTLHFLLRWTRVSLTGSDKVGVWTSNELSASYTDRIIRSDGDVFINFVRKIWRCCYRRTTQYLLTKFQRWEVQK